MAHSDGPALMTGLAIRLFSKVGQLVALQTEAPRPYWLGAMGRPLMLTICDMIDGTLL